MKAITCNQFVIPVLSFFTEIPSGQETAITGTAGVIVSPNFPFFYPHQFFHKWIVTVSTDSTIELTVSQLQTEPTNDRLTVSNLHLHLVTSQKLTILKFRPIPAVVTFLD